MPRDPYRRQSFLRCYDVFGVATIVGDATDLLVCAGDEVTAAAGFADDTVSEVPADADPLALLPGIHPVTNSIDATRDLMAGHARELQAGEEAFLDQGVAVADAARFHLYAY